jgi:hypothetical protein
MYNFSFSNYFKTSSLLSEGGNVFEASSPIRKEDITPTMQEFFKQFETVFPAARLHFEGIRTLGSVGKKDISGDIDLALSENSFKNIDDWGLDKNRIDELFATFKKKAKTATEEQLTKRAVIVAIAEKLVASNTDIVTDVKGSAAGALFCQFPQFDSSGNQLDKKVQIDINIGNVDWLTFAYHSATYQGNVKGLHRTQLLVSLFSHKGYTFSHNYGVKNKETQEITASTPDQAVKLLNKLYKIHLDKETVGDYHTLIDVLKRDLSEEDLHAVFDTYLRILDSTRADIPDDLQQYWIDNQERLNLKGKFLPEDSNLFKYKI